VQDWPLDEVSPGDLLVVWGTGAYGFVAASNYNSRPRPAEVLVEGNRFRIIRRRESRAILSVASDAISVGLVCGFRYGLLPVAS